MTRRNNKKPALRPATPEEFDGFIANYPRELVPQVTHICAPPLLAYRDPATGHVVAYCSFDDHLATNAREVPMSCGHVRKEAGWHIPKRPLRKDTK